MDWVQRFRSRRTPLASVGTSSKSHDKSMTTSAQESNTIWKKEVDTDAPLTVSTLYAPSDASRLWLETLFPHKGNECFCIHSNMIHDSAVSKKRNKKVPLSVDEFLLPVTTRSHAI